jgi:hypothetical protein
MLTKRDRLILNHIEHFKFITIQQCADLFFYNVKSRYTCARKRLNILSQIDWGYIDEKNKNKLIKKSTNIATGKISYSYDGRNVSEHSTLIMDFYTQMIINGAEVLEYVKEKRWMNGKIISDAFCKYKYRGITKILLLEVDYVHDTELNKYTALYNSNEIQTIYKCFPPIVLVNRYETKQIPDKLLSKIKFKFIDFKYNDFEEKILNN